MNYKQFDICIILQNNIPITVCYFISTPGNYYDTRYCSYPETLLDYRRWGSLPYKNTPTIFYIVELKESLFKIGITLSGSIQKRYKDDKNFRLLKPKTILEISFIDGYDAWNLEQYTLTMFKENKYASKIPILSRTGNTEILTVSPLEFVKTSILNNKFKDTT